MMFNKKMRSIVALCFSFMLSSSVYSAGEKKQFITIKLVDEIGVRNVFLPLFKEFELDSGIKVIPLHYINDAEFKEYIQKNQRGEISLPDVLNGLHSERLFPLIRDNLVHPITQLWKDNNWQEVFPAKITDWVTYNNEIYALPYTKYTWGFFYRKSFLQKFGPVPSDWSGFLKYCKKLQNAGLDLFPHTERQPWVAAAWFEYLILRTYGIELLDELTQGTISYYDPRIQNVLIGWQSLIDKGYFSNKYSGSTTEELLPYLLRNKFAFMFISNSLARRIYAPDVLADMQFMPFPSISNIPQYETSPASVFFISKQSPNKENAKEFLTFIAKPAVQERIAKGLFSLPVGLQSKSPGHPLSVRADNILKSAKDISPFFDRAINQDFSKGALAALAEFNSLGNLTKLTKTLENARLRYYPNASSKPLSNP